MKPRRTPGQRAGLTREAVVEAAHALVAQTGLDALTMRALADQLAVAPNTLYSHVANKTALIDEILDDVLALVVEPKAGVAPATGLHQLMSSTYDVLMAHPDLVPLYLARQGARGSNAVRLGEIVDSLLAQVGVVGRAGDEARRALIVFTIGYAAFGSGAPSRDLGPDFATGLDWLITGMTTTPAPLPLRKRRR